MNLEKYSYKNHEIAILYTNNTYTVSVRNKKEELLKIWFDIKTFMLAGSKAQEYIDNLQGE